MIDRICIGVAVGVVAAFLLAGCGDASPPVEDAGSPLGSSETGSDAGLSVVAPEAGYAVPWCDGHPDDARCADASRD